MDGSGRGADQFSSQEELWGTNSSPRSSGLCSAFSDMDLCCSGMLQVLFLETGQSIVPRCPASPVVLQKATGRNFGVSRFGFYTFLKFIHPGGSAPSTSCAWHLFSTWMAYAKPPISALWVRDTEACTLSSGSSEDLGGQCLCSLHTRLCRHAPMNPMNVMNSESISEEVAGKGLLPANSLWHWSLHSIRLMFSPISGFRGWDL